jgi:hypothetical protein
MVEGLVAASVAAGVAAILAAIPAASSGVPPSGPPLTCPACPAVTATDSDALPAVRRGFLFLPYAGTQFPIHGPDWISYSFRTGALLGGHLTKNFSLSGEPAVATWAFCNSSGNSCAFPHHAVELDAAAVLLRHVYGPRAHFFFGPKLGWSVVLRNNYAERTYMFVNGPQLGAKMGVFETSSNWISLGLVADVAYTRSYKSSSRCLGADDVDCNDTKNTAFVALSAALLF